MNKYYWLLIFGMLLSACGSIPEGEPSMMDVLPTASRANGAYLSVSGETPTQTPTPTPNAVETARMVIVYDAATSTAAAAATGTSVAVTTTSEAKATEAFWVGVTFAVATEQRIETKVAQTQIAGTQQSAGQTAIPLTQTPLAATQQLESDKLQAERVSLWIYRVGFALFVVALLAVFVVVLLKGIPIAQEAGNAQVMRMKTDALKPDEHGRRPAVPSSTLKPGEKLLLPELAHRSALGVEGDDLTPDQALSNTGDHRKLEAVRSLSESPVMPRLLAKVADSMAKQMMPQGSGTVSLGTPIQHPEHPLLNAESLPALPAPHYKTLFGWDGHLLPYGVDEGGQLMRVDPTRNPHLMIAGGTGSGKTRSGIRTLVSGALASGWNVVVVGKRVDFLPFEDHPNIKILAVDVRKESGRYVDILRVLTAQMDVRDNLMAARNISTWDRYGGPQTLVVLDDFTGAMMRMPSAAAKEVLNEAKQIAMDGRKFGLNLVLGLQRATWTSLDTDLRSQMGRIVFRVASAGDSRVALDEAGAERLPFLNYLTRLNDDEAIQRGVGFMLQDPEVEAFLHSRPVQQNDAQDWIEGVVTPDDSPSAKDVDSQHVGDDARIRSLYLDYLTRQEKPSLRAIETSVFGKTGGSYHNAVKTAIADLEGCSPDDVAGVIARHVESWSATSPGATTGDLPHFDPLPA